MFTADPRQIPEARLLRRLDYDEAQEIASTGAKVLHPRAVAPVRRHGIPMTIRCAPSPDMEGTEIRERPAGGAPQVKALSSKRNVTLVSMDNQRMWQEAGFLADVFGVFNAQGISVDLVSTSETNVTVTLDHAANALDGAALETLASALAEHCNVTITEGLAAVSLVGIGIRSILHRLGTALEQFEEQPIHLVSQAASDLNLTFVVDADREERMLRRLHSEVFQSASANETFGPTWRDLFEPVARTAAPRVAHWWQRERDQLLAVAEAGTPVYAYHGDTIRAAAAGLQGIESVDRVFFAMKANSCPDVLRVVEKEGLGFECVSPGEIQRVTEVIGDPLDGRLLFTPNFAPREDYAAGYEAGATVTVDNVHPLRHWGDVFAGRELMVRVDVGVGRGHHKHVKTAGARSKFGVDPDELPEVAALAREAGARIVGLHAHSGSGIKTPEAWRDVATRLGEHARAFPDVRRLDVGGGLGIPEKPGQSPLDLGAVDSALAAVRLEFGIEELWIEPGRYVVAESGVLLARVTQIKRKRDVTWIGVDAGMHTLIRPALYGAWHEIVNLTRLGEKPSQSVQVVGPICETGDLLGRNRRLPETQEGDVLLIATAGAYGRTMASEYNLRGLPREVLV
jgi:diaminopimelate decarboxylase/aspartate kinase